MLENHTNTVSLGEKKLCRIGLGCFGLTADPDWQTPQNKQQAIQLLQKAVDMGVNLIDTADCYGPFSNESLICEALYPYPPELMIATKGGLIQSGPELWQVNASPAQLTRACDASLKRLKLDCIELYFLHSPDPTIPFAVSVCALARLQQAGKIKHIGLSNVTVNQLEQAQQFIEVAAVQNRFNLFHRGSQDVLAWCEARKIPLLAWHPLAGVGHFDAEHAQAQQKIQQLASENQVTPSQLVLTWLLQTSDMLLPIPGTSKEKHLLQNMQSLKQKLDLRTLLQLNLLA